MNGCALIQNDAGCWVFGGAPIPYLDPDADIWPIAEVPPYGYAESLAFDFLFSEILRTLQNAWDTGDSDMVSTQSVEMMAALSRKAKELMTKPKLDGSGMNYAPDFRYLP